MAIYHCSIKIIGRGKGKSAVRSAAYRAGENIKNDYDGQTYDYTRKRGVIHTEILIPDHAPRDYFDRAVLWNAVEQIEKAKNAQLAREIEIALPVELPMEQNISLAREYAEKFFVSAGMCADICVHDTGNGNPHAHIMLTLRPIEPDGAWGAKSKKEYILDDNGKRIKLPSGEDKSRKVYTVDWNEQSRAEEWRGGWADMVNRYLSEHGITERIDHRSYERQGVDTIPSIHMGVAASQMERKGIRTERGDINRQVEVSNQQLRQLRARIRKSKEWLYAQPIDNAPTMMSIMSHIADAKNLDTRWKKIRNIKTQAKILMFLQNNHITDMAHLVDKVVKINDEFKDVSDEIKKVDRRLGTLETHLLHFENHKKHRTVYDQYKKLDPKKRDAFYDRNSDEIEAYKDARDYLNTVMTGREGESVPVKAWQDEQAAMNTKRFSLCEMFYTLQDEIRNVELLRKGTEGIMREETWERTITQTQGLEF